MKTLLLLALLALAGCTADQVALVQEKARELCSFVPTATSVAAILAVNNPTVTGVGNVATAICVAVVKKPPIMSLYQTGNCPRVNGVCVEGGFVEKGK